MKRTIIPHGKFLLYWEIQRAFFAWITAIVFPALILIRAKYPDANNFAIFLDIIAAIDM